VERHYKILEARLANQPYMLGSSYTIVDMALWGWARLIPYVMGNPEAWKRFPNVRRLHDEINARPSAAGVERLRNQYKFKTEMDEEARRFMFPQLERLGMS
jgi:GST-like protein